MLVIEDDEWVSRLLTNAIRDAGYDVVACSTAKEGFETACSEEPSCIICDIELPDGDGFWVARNIRTQPTRVSVTPFIFLSGLDDPQSRMVGYQVGGDIYITKPFRIQEVVAQIEALVQMAARMRHRHDSIHNVQHTDAQLVDDLNSQIDAPVQSATSETLSLRDIQKTSEVAVTAIEGDLSQMSIATVLTVLEMERRTGLFEVVSKKRRAQLEIASGAVVQGTVGGTRVSALTTLRTMLGWTVGRFSFTPLPAREAPPNRKSIGAFLLEAVRLEDEAMRDELELPPPSKRAGGQKLAAPALGGPASTSDDLAPRSSRASMPPPVPSSTIPATRASTLGGSPRAPTQSSPPNTPAQTPARAAAHSPSRPTSQPATTRSHGASEPPPGLSETSAPAPSTLNLDMDDISSAPATGAPLLRGLAHITGTFGSARQQALQAGPPKPPPPPPKTATSASPTPPRPTGGASPSPTPPPHSPPHAAPHSPPPLPRREAPTPPKPHTPPPLPTTAPRRAADEGPSGRLSVPSPTPPRPAAARPGPPPLPTAHRPTAPPPLPKPDTQPKKR